MKLLKNHKKITFGYLFGSRAENRAVKSSDHDFAFYLNEKSLIKRNRMRLELIDKLSKEVSGNVDVIILNDIHSLTLAYSIITKGRLVNDTDVTARQNYELRTMCDYEDFSPFLAEYNKAYIKAAL